MNFNTLGSPGNSDEVEDDDGEKFGEEFWQEYCGRPAIYVPEIHRPALYKSIDAEPVIELLGEVVAQTESSDPLKAVLAQCLQGVVRFDEIHRRERPENYTPPISLDTDTIRTFAHGAYPNNPLFAPDFRIEDINPVADGASVTSIFRNTRPPYGLTDYHQLEITATEGA